MNRIAIRHYLEIADQPTPEDLVALDGDGFTAVVNLRRAGEPDQPVDPEAEGDLVRGAGVEYLAAPVGGGPLDPDGVEAVCELIDRHVEQGGKVLLHCKQGGRAAGLAVIHLARAEGWPDGEAIERAEAIGLRLPPPVRALVESYYAR